MIFLGNFTIARKLWCAMVFIIAAMAVGAIFNQHRIVSTMQSAVDQMAGSEARIQDAVAWKQLVDRSFLQWVASTQATDPAVAARFQKEVSADIDAISALHARVAAAARSPEEVAALSRIEAQASAVLARIDRGRSLRRSQAEGEPGGALADDLWTAAADRYAAALDDYVAILQAQREQAARSAKSQSGWLLRFGIAGTAVVALVALALTALLVRAIDGPLKKTVALSRAIASGDLGASIETDRRDEFGDLLRAMDVMMRRLRSVVGEVRKGVDSVGAASQQIATGGADLSRRTEEQASSVQQTAASMEQLTATVRQNVDSARAAAHIAGEVSQVAGRGGEVVNEVIATMGHISSSARKVQDIVSIIDGIAFRTNLLALNAAVEAARAGEQGRGFAVVAAEVRSLARRSGLAAQEIKQLIEASGHRVDEGCALVTQAGQTMEELVVRVRRVTELVTEISAASVEQARGIEDVGRAVSQLDQATQQNAVLVDKSSAAADSMRRQALTLADTVAVFNLRPEFE